MANPSAEGYGNWDSSGQQWRSWVKIEQTAITDTTATYKVSAWMCARNGSSSYASNIKGWAGIWDAATGDYRWSSAVNVGSFSAGDEWCFKEQSWTVNRTHAAQTVYAYADVIASAGIYSGRESNTTGSNVVTLGLAAKTSYAVTYNANGGSGAPAAQTKWHGEALTLRDGAPTRSGYTFMGWGTSATATSASYASGASYTANKAATLYAVWRKAIKLTYGANGGSGAPAAVTQYAYNAATSSTFTLSTTRPTRANHTFLGWSTSSTATSATYAPGAKVTLSSSTNLYAVWKVVASSPAVSSLSAFRSTDSGAADAASTAYVTFVTKWSVDASATSRSIRYAYRVGSGATTTVTETLSAASGTTTKTVAVTLPEASTLSVTVTVTDSTHSLSASKSATVPVVAYPVTWRDGGMSMGIFGMAKAGLSKVLQVFGHIYVRGALRFEDAFDTTPGNAPSSNAYGGAIQAYDSDGERNFYSQTAVTTGDVMYRSFVAERHVGGVQYLNGIYLRINADGTPSIAFSSGGSAAWRAALGLGESITKDISTAVSVASSSYVNLGSVALANGQIWVVTAGIQYPTNATGRRYIVLYNSNGNPDAAYLRSSGVSANAVSGGSTYLHTSRVFDLSDASSGTTTIYLKAWQNSGGALSVTGFIHASRIG